MHRRLQIRKQAPQSKMRKLRPKGLLRLLCAGVVENANHPTFYVEPSFTCIHDDNVHNEKSLGKSKAFVGAEGVEPPTLCL